MKTNRKQNNQKHNIRNISETPRSRDTQQQKTNKNKRSEASKTQKQKQEQLETQDKHEQQESIQQTTAWEKPTSNNKIMRSSRHRNT